MNSCRSAIPVTSVDVVPFQIFISLLFKTSEGVRGHQGSHKNQDIAVGQMTADTTSTAQERGRMCMALDDQDCNSGLQWQTTRTRLNRLEGKRETTALGPYVIFLCSGENGEHMGATCPTTDPRNG